MDVSKNSGTPKSSILIGFSIINHLFWGSRIFGNTHMHVLQLVGYVFWKDCEDCWKRLVKLKKSIARAQGVHLRVIVIGSFKKNATFYTCMIGVVPSQDLNVHYFTQEITSMMWVEYVHHLPYDQLCWHHIPAEAINTSKQKNASQFSGANGDVYSHRFQNAHIAESPD